MMEAEENTREGHGGAKGDGEGECGEEEPSVQHLLPPGRRDARGEGGHRHGKPAAAVADGGTGAQDRGGTESLTDCWAAAESSS